MFVIIKSGGKYVAELSKNNGKSYTRKLQDARVFKVREDAQKDCCGNERVITLDEAF